MKHNDDMAYWEHYYRNNPSPFSETRFAHYVVHKWLQPGMRVVELGCGNGRDAVYMANNGIQVLALDQCSDEIKFLNNNFGDKNLEFRATDFSCPGIHETFDAVYSRFTMHAISAAQQAQTLQWCNSHLNTGGLMLIEARGTKNEYYGRGTRVPDDKNAFIYENHYRRFINRAEMVQAMREMGLAIRFSTERRGFAPFGDTDYKFVRIVAQKIACK